MSLGIKLAIGGIILSVFGISATLLIFLLNRSSKELELRVIPGVHFIGNELSDRIVILFDGVEIEQLWLSSFLLRNTGEVDVAPGDFDEPPYFLKVGFFPEPDEILEIIPGESQPQGIKFKLSKSGGQLAGSSAPEKYLFELEPLLLKCQESLNFSVLSTTQIFDLRTTNRIKGIDEVNINYFFGAEHANGFNFIWVSLAVIGMATKILVISVSTLLHLLPWETRRPT